MGKSVEELALLGDIASQNEVSDKGKLPPVHFAEGKRNCITFQPFLGLHCM